MEGEGVRLIFVFVGRMVYWRFNIMIFLAGSSSNQLIGKPGGPALPEREATSPHILPLNEKTTSIAAYRSKIGLRVESE